MRLWWRVHLGKFEDTKSQNKDKQKVDSAKKGLHFHVRDKDWIRFRDCVTWKDNPKKRNRCHAMIFPMIRHQNADAMVRLWEAFTPWTSAILIIRELKIHNGIHQIYDADVTKNGR
jgi:hypothetical protein